MSALTLELCNALAVGLFGIALSAAFCNIGWDKADKRRMLVGMAAIFLMQAVVYIGVAPSVGRRLYPLHTHLPLTILLCRLSHERLWPLVSVLTAYLYCQVRRWLALVIVAALGGDGVMQSAAELLITLPLLLLLLRTAPAVRSISRYSLAVRCQFGLIPALYYAFDYFARVYTDLLSSGSPVVVEFMPFVCSVAYLIFIYLLSGEQRARTHFEQLQSSLNLQVSQAMREIDALRDSQRKTCAYRHDLRHHLQYLSVCLENGQYAQAQDYIRSISAEIEAGRVTVYCENEAANLIFSAFAGRAEAQGIPFAVHAALPHILPVSDSDLCVLLSNALENALHACREQGAGGVEVQAYEKNGRLFLQIANDCTLPVRFERGVPVTDRPGHGVGVRSICAMAERYGGVYSFSLREGRFLLRVSL